MSVTAPCVPQGILAAKRTKEPKRPVERGASAPEELAQALQAGTTDAEFTFGATRADRLLGGNHYRLVQPETRRRADCSDHSIWSYHAYEAARFRTRRSCRQRYEDGC